MLIRFLPAGIALALSALLPSTAYAQHAPTRLSVTTAFIAAGGGPGAGSFSSVRAFSQTLGADALQTQMQALRKRFGGRYLDRFVHIFDYAFIDGWRVAGQDDVKMPPPNPNTGTGLIMDMLRSGKGSSNAFHMTTMMDALWTPRVQAQVDNDIASRFGKHALAMFKRVGDRFFYDIGRSLG